MLLTITGNQSAISYVTPNNAVMIVGELRVLDAATLGILTLTWRWTENSVAKTHIETISLTLLNSFKPIAFPIVTDNIEEDIATVEASVSGLVGTFVATLSMTEQNYNPYDPLV